ncbi:MAG: TadE/TadG family type IV pilus assembly protein [Chloroflexota bacterium]
MPSVTFPASRRGQALVELALLMPVLMLLAMATLDVGRVFQGYLDLANAAREGAAYASLNPSDANLTTDVTNIMTTESNGLVPGTMNVTVSFSPDTSVGSQVTVTATASYPLLTTAVLGWTSIDLKASAGMMVQ